MENKKKYINIYFKYDLGFFTDLEIGNQRQMLFITTNPLTNEIQQKQYFFYFD